LEPPSPARFTPPAAAAHVAEQIFDTFAHSPSGVALIGADGRFLRANDALGRMLGCSRRELARTRWQDVFPGEPGAGDHDLPLRRPGGAERRLRCRTRALDEATTLACFEDVAAERETALLAAVVASVSDAVVTTDRESRIVFLNDAAERMFGIRCADVAGRSVVEALVHPDDRAVAHEWACRLARGEAVPGARLIRLRRADGSMFDGELSIFAVRDGDTLLGLGGMVRDVGDRLAREAEAGVMRAVVESAAEGIIGIDADGDVRFFSPSAERIYGYRADELIGRPATVLAPHDRQAQAWTLREELRAGGTVHRDTVARRKDGTHIDVHLIASPIAADDGSLSGAAVTVLDVSERRRAQHLLQRLIDHAPSVIAFKDIDGRYRVINRHAARMLHRCEPEAVVGRTDHELFSPDVADRFRDQDRRVIAAAAPMTFVDDLARPDGPMLSYLTTKFPILGPDGAPDGVGLIAADVTEIRRAQADRTQLAALVQAAPDAIITQDRDGLIATWNPSAQRMFGLTAEEAIGRPYVETIIPPAERASYGRLRDEIRAGRTVTLRMPRLRADGSVFPAQVSTAPLGDDGTLAIVRDISDLVAAEETLAERAAQLERSNADLERFAYAASHDLQEPLRSMKLGAATVLGTAAGRLDDDERALLGHIEAAATRLSAQVRGLMEVAQVGLGHWPEERVPLELAVQDAVDALRAAAEAAGAEIDVQPLPAAQVPRAEVSLVMQNLIANAIKYQRRDVQPRITVTGSRDEGHVEVRVADNGVGLSEVDKARIFGVFERAHPGIPGTGMGLAVARRMLERHGGSLSAASPGQGRGSQFIVRLPA
jgi:PAS domain S-box-containing protein